MQDNESKYTNKLCLRCIKNKEEKHVFQLMFWLAHSAELNPIELVWEDLEQKVKAKQSISAAHHEQFLQARQNYIQSTFSLLLERMPRIC